MKVEVATTGRATSILKSVTPLSDSSDIKTHADGSTWENAGHPFLWKNTQSGETRIGDGTDHFASGLVPYSSEHHDDLLARSKAFMDKGIKATIDTGTSQRLHEFAKEQPSWTDEAHYMVGVKYHIPNEAKLAGIRLENKNKDFAILHRSSKPRVNWQASYFGSDGTPHGDIPRQTAEEALNDIVDYNGLKTPTDVIWKSIFLLHSIRLS